MPLGSFHGDDDLRERLVKVETELFNVQANFELHVQLAVEKVRTDMAKKQGRSEIVEWLVFGVAGLIILGFSGPWVPARVDLARPGQTLWLQRDLEFTNKTLATVTRVMVCEGGFQLSWPPVPPPTRTVERTVKQFQVTIPDKAEGRCVYQVAAIFYKNPSQPEVRVAFQPVPITVVP